MKLVFLTIVAILLTIASGDARRLSGGGTIFGPMRVADFTAKIGINGALDSGLTSAEEITDAAYLGIYNWRQGIWNSTASGFDANTWFGNAAPLAAAGIRQHFHMDGNTGAEPFNAGMSAYLAALKSQIVFPYGAKMVLGLSGPNETDIQPWQYNTTTGVAGANAAQADLYAAVHADPVLAGTIPVDMWPVSLFGTLAAVGNQTAVCDRYNMHDYYATDNNTFITYGGLTPAFGPMSQQYSYIKSDYTQFCNQKLFISTESGYGSAPCAGSFCNSTADDATQTRLVLMNLFMHASDPLLAVGFYFTDRWGNGPPCSESGCWGLMTDTGSPKQSGIATHWLMNNVLADAGGTAKTFTTAPFTYSVTGLDATRGHSFVLAKSNGKYEILLWEEVPTWNFNTANDLPIAPHNVTVTFSGNWSGGYYDIVNAGPALLGAYTSQSSVTVSMSDAPLIVEATQGSNTLTSWFTAFDQSTYITPGGTIGAAAGTVTPTLTNAALSGETFSIPGSGTDSVTSYPCPSMGPTNFTINSSTGVVTTLTALTPGTPYSFCVAVAQAGVSNTGYTRLFSTFAIGSGLTIVQGNLCYGDRNNHSLASTTCIITRTSPGTGFLINTGYCENDLCNGTNGGNAPTIAAASGGTCAAFTGSLSRGTAEDRATIWFWCTGQTGKTQTFTITHGGAQVLNFPVTNAIEVAHMNAAPDDGVAAGAVGSSTSVSATTGTTATTNDMVFMGTSLDDPITYTITAGTVVPNTDFMSYVAAPTLATYNLTATLSGSEPWVTSIVAVKHD